MEYETLAKKEIFEQLEEGFRNVNKIIIAAINGKALGGGFELALLCDTIVCSDNASFGLPEVNLGLIPGMGGTQRLTRIIGEKLAMRYILTGESMTGG